MHFLFRIWACFVQVLVTLEPFYLHIQTTYTLITGLQYGPSDLGLNCLKNVALILYGGLSGWKGQDCNMILVIRSVILFYTAVLSNVLCNAHNTCIIRHNALKNRYIFTMRYSCTLIILFESVCIYFMFALKRDWYTR